MVLPECSYEILETSAAVRKMHHAGAPERTRTLAHQRLQGWSSPAGPMASSPLTVYPLFPATVRRWLARNRPPHWTGGMGAVYQPTTKHGPPRSPSSDALRHGLQSPNSRRSNMNSSSRVKSLTKMSYTHFDLGPAEGSKFSPWITIEGELARASFGEEKNSSLRSSQQSWRQVCCPRPRTAHNEGVHPTIATSKRQKQSSAWINFLS